MGVSAAKMDERKVLLPKDPARRFLEIVAISFHNIFSVKSKTSLTILRHAANQNRYIFSLCRLDYMDKVRVDVRPHPNPLPQEREDLLGRVWIVRTAKDRGHQNWVNDGRSFTLS